jgi:hypothetical protein
MQAMAGSATMIPQRMNSFPISVFGNVCPNALDAPQNENAENADARRPKKPIRHPVGIGVSGILYIIFSNERYG